MGISVIDPSAQNRLNRLFNRLLTWLKKNKGNVSCHEDGLWMVLITY